MEGVCRSSQQAASALAASGQQRTDVSYVRAMDGKEPLHAVAASSQAETARRGITALGQTPTKRTGIDGVRL